MRRILFSLAALCFFIAASHAATTSHVYSTKLAPLVPKEARENGKLGVVVKSLSTGETLFEHNPDKLFIPASNEKIITSVSALSLLKKDYKFKTDFSSGGGISKGILHGGLYIKGYGDPTLESAHLGYIVFQLKKLGVKEIKGEIIVDDSYFGPNRYAKGWKEEWKNDFYSPPISALSFNYNVIKIKIRSSKLGNRPTVTIEPNGSGIKITNKAVTSTKKGVLRTTWQNDESITLTGVIKPKAIVNLKIPVLNPALLTGNAIKNALREGGITISGEVKQGYVPRWANTFYTHYSAPLSTIIAEYNKNSVNIIGENLIKTLGATYLGVPGTWDKGASVISEFLSKIGVKNGYIVVDGSGLSLLNRISPETFTDVLSYAYTNKLISQDFITSLPVAGVDGTLKKRFRNTEIEGRVMAKTGYLKNVRALSGYVYTKSGEVLVFSILSNGLGWKAKTFQSDLLTELVDCCTTLPSKAAATN